MPKRTDISRYLILGPGLMLSACANATQSRGEVAGACLTDVATLEAVQAAAKRQPGLMFKAGRCTVSVWADGKMRAAFIDKHPVEIR